MGTYKIEIEAVGGHGADRTAKPGDTLNLGEPGPYNPDAQAKAFVDALAATGGLVSATLTHWPDTTPIVDDLKAGVRLARSFSDAVEGEPILQFFSFAHLPPAMQALSRPFCPLAHPTVATVPRNAERSASLRKLLEAKDAAVRAAIAK